MSKDKQHTPALGDKVSFYLSGYSEHRGFDKRTQIDSPMGPYLGLVAHVTAEGRRVNLLVLDASARLHSRVNVRVLAPLEAIPEECDSCTLEIHGAPERSVAA